MQLDAFNVARVDRYLALTDGALRLAAKLWAQALTTGLPSSDLVIATTNVGHLSRFVTADLWANITP